MPELLLTRLDTPIRLGATRAANGVRLEWSSPHHLLQSRADAGEWSQVQPVPGASVSVLRPELDESTGRFAYDTRAGNGQCWRVHALVADQHLRRKPDQSAADECDAGRRRLPLEIPR